MSIATYLLTFGMLQKRVMVLSKMNNRITANPYSKNKYIVQRRLRCGRVKSVSEAERAWFPRKTRKSEVESRGAVASPG
jgi:hypothetical protein